MNAIAHTLEETITSETHDFELLICGLSDEGNVKQPLDYQGTFAGVIEEVLNVFRSSFPECVDAIYAEGIFGSNENLMAQVFARVPLNGIVSTVVVDVLAIKPRVAFIR